MIFLSAAIDNWLVVSSPDKNLPIKQLCHILGKPHMPKTTKQTILLIIIRQWLSTLIDNDEVSKWLMNNASYYILLYHTIQITIH